MRTEGYRDVLLSTLIIASLMVPAISLLSLSPSSAAPEGLTSHVPIYIISNENFIPANGVVGGSGTENDPYIVENYSINAENANGIDIRNTTDYFIIRNCLVENGVDNYNGIHLENVVNGRVESCVSRNNFNGIHVSYSSHISISYNTCENNHDDGIHVRDYSSYISITHNTCRNNFTDGSDGIQISDSSYTSISHNICDNNHASGIYLKSNSSNNTVDNNVCVSSIYGIHLSDSDNNVISSNILGSNVFGVRLKGSSNNVLEGNICENNSWGIYLRFSSDNNTMHHNCLLFNTENNGYDGDTNAWDDGSEGNRWSDWQPPEHPDADGDGIVDEPRPIMVGRNQDRYPIVFGVRVGISPSENSAEPCTTLEYTVKLANLNYVDDNFDLTWVDTENWGDNIWLGDSSLWIRRCGSEKTTTLYVHIPYGVEGCTRDNITVIATSQSDNTVSDNDSCVAHVAVVKGVEVSISPEYQSGEPSTVLDYTVTVRNTGNVDDVYDLSWADNEGWGDNIWLEDNSLSAARHGGENSTTLHVHVPECTEGSTEDNITVTATSQFDNTVSDSDSCIAHVAIVRGVEVSISPSENGAEPCNWLEYTVTVRNTGNVDGNFDLSWTDTEGWGDNIWLEDNVLWVDRCDGENSTTLHVHILWCAEGCTWDNITVTATSQDNTNIKDNDTCRAHVDIVRGVDVSISPSEDSGAPGTTLTYAVTIKNTGNVGDTYDLTVNDNAGWDDNIWLGVNSLWVGRCGGENTTTLHAHIPHGVEGCTRDNITVTATSQSDNTVSDNDSCIAHVAIVRGVEVSILPEENSAEPCTTLKYTVTVTNTSNVDDTYSLTVIDNENWGPTLDDSSLSIPFGESQTTTLSVHIPENLIGYTRDNITVTATGTGVENSDSCIAHAEIVRGVEVLILPYYQENVPGGTLEYEVTVTNTGNVGDTYDLTASDNENWGLSIASSITVPAFENQTTTLTVTVPENEIGCTRDNITVTATGTGVENSASCIAHAEIVRGVKVLISPSFQGGTPEMTLAYTVTITNMGNVEDTYDTTVTDNAGWDPKFDLVQVKLAPYGLAMVWYLEVTVPEDAPLRAEDNITVTATSTDNVVSDSDSCIAHRSKAEFSLVTLYKAGLDVDLYLGMGSSLIVKFYTYVGDYQAENVVWSGTTPDNVNFSKTVPHPLGGVVQHVRLVLAAETGAEIATVASFTVTRDDLFGRIMEIKGLWPIASPDERNTLFQEIMDIKGVWPFAPS